MSATQEFEKKSVPIPGSRASDERSSYTPVYQGSGVHFYSTTKPGGNRCKPLKTNSRHRVSQTSAH
jgi:hypothetical protein